MPRHIAPDEAVGFVLGSRRHACDKGSSSTSTVTRRMVRCCMAPDALVECATQVTMRNNETVLIADAANKEEIDARVAQIKKELSETDSVYDTEKLSERVAKLAGGVAVIKVSSRPQLPRTYLSRP